MKIPNNIMDLSRRTITKVMKRMNLACSRCGWNEEVCDVHHIVPKSMNGTDDHTNLCYLCPNCHRLAHAGKITDFITLQDFIGDSWREYYYAKYQDWLKSLNNEQRTLRAKESYKNLTGYIDERSAKIDEQVPRIMAELKSSGIDFTKYGWVTKAAPIIGITRQRVITWLRRNAPKFYSTCYKQSNNSDIK